MSDFWKELLSLSGTKLQFTTAYHPQTDGQSEVTNRALEQYLRAFTFDRPSRWSQLLPWSELALNCSTNVSIGMSPFQALYGREPPNLFDTYSKPSHNQTVAELLTEREEVLRLLKKRIARSQDRMAEFANRQRRDVEFKVGDKVLLKLQPYRQHSVAKPLSSKLGCRYYGPFDITERIGRVAYRLKLPLDSRVHDVFHVSLLKPFVPPFSLASTAQLPGLFHRGSPVAAPLKVIAARTVLVQGIPQDQWQVSWSLDDTTATSWEPVEEIQKHFPDIHLEDKAVALEGGVDRDSNPRTFLSGKPEESTIVVSDQQQRPEQNAADANESTREEEPKAKIVGRAKGQASRPQGPGRPKRSSQRPIKYKDYVMG